MTPTRKTVASLRFVAALGLCASCSTKAGAEARPALAEHTAKSVMLVIEGMTCVSCSVAIRTALKRLDGVHEAQVTVEKKCALVDYEPARVTPRQMREAVNRLGYRAKVAREGA